jgi:hypothetical protein
VSRPNRHVDLILKRIGPPVQSRDQNAFSFAVINAGTRREGSIRQLRE